MLNPFHQSWQSIFEQPDGWRYGTWGLTLKWMLCGHETVVNVVKRFLCTTALFTATFTKWHVVVELIKFDVNSYCNHNWGNPFLKIGRFISAPPCISEVRKSEATGSRVSAADSGIKRSRGSLLYIKWFIIVDSRRIIGNGRVCVALYYTNCVCGSR